MLVVRRRGYRSGQPVPASASVDEQVADLVAVVDARGVSSATFVGVSGGATLVLALALARPDLVRAAVVHEPAIGPLAPDLHAELQSAAGRLAAAGGPEGVLAFVNRLVGDSAWARLPPLVADEIESRWEVVRAEVPEFIAFAPSAEALAGLEGLGLVATVGSRSPECRRLAAKVLESQAGATVQVLDGVRHLPHLEAPDRFVAAIRGPRRPTPRGAKRTTPTSGDEVGRGPELVEHDGRAVAGEEDPPEGAGTGQLVVLGVGDGEEQISLCRRRRRSCRRPPARRARAPPTSPACRACPGPAGPAGRRRGEEQDLVAVGDHRLQVGGQLESVPSGLARHRALGVADRHLAVGGDHVRAVGQLAHLADAAGGLRVEQRGQRPAVGVDADDPPGRR